MSGGCKRGGFTLKCGRSFDGSRHGLVPIRYAPAIASSVSRTALAPNVTGLVTAGGACAFLTIYRGDVTVCRARLAPEMISTPGHRDLGRRQRRTVPGW